ncbi:MAG: hypothetical protein M1814_000596 [Vezdaea aestivalis]|nr:MAG: hypothetical protein M1814_000596 [Vezdaea aestivalis]
MHLSNFLIQFLSLLAIVCAVDSESFTVLEAAATARGITLQTGVTYMFRELWPIRPGDDPNDPTHGISGARHVRLIVGIITGTLGNRDFRATAYDLGVTTMDANGLPMGQPTDIERAQWRAKHRPNPAHMPGNLGAPQWIRVGMNNNYEYVGVPEAALDVIEERGLEYVRANPIYRLENVNCRSYVNYLVGAFGKGPIWKRDVEQPSGHTFDDGEFSAIPIDGDELSKRTICARSMGKAKAAVLQKRAKSAKNFEDRMKFC